MSVRSAASVMSQPLYSLHPAHKRNQAQRLNWVKLRSLSAQLGSPLYPQEQTSPARACQVPKVPIGDIFCWQGTAASRRVITPEVLLCGYLRLSIYCAWATERRVSPIQRFENWVQAQAGGKPPSALRLHVQDGPGLMRGSDKSWHKSGSGERLSWQPR